MNEEEVKNKIVVPFLRRLGVTDDEMRFEQTFSLDFGTNQIKVSGKRRSRKTRTARLDTLVTRNGRNLLIWEYKEDGHDFTDDDRAQATSYARLVHPITPFALLTNGTDYQLVDSVTRQIVDETKLKLRDVYEVKLSPDDRQDAIDLFLGFSPDNLLAFCRSQVEAHMRPLIGSPAELTKKYIPELTVVRKELSDQLTAFETSSASAFLVLADSGSGKTSGLCDYARGRLAEGKPTLFFSGGTLEAGLLSAITDEFNWTFGDPRVYRRQPPRSVSESQAAYVSPGGGGRGLFRYTLWSVAGPFLHTSIPGAALRRPLKRWGGIICTAGAF